MTIRAESAEVDLGVLGLGLPATVDDPSSVEVDMAVLGGGLGVLYFTWRWTWSTVLYLEVDLEYCTFLGGGLGVLYCTWRKIWVYLTWSGHCSSQFV